MELVYLDGKLECTEVGLTFKCIINVRKKLGY